MDADTPHLIERFQAGDRDAYGRLFERYRRPLERFIQCHADDGLRRHISVSDLLQETHMQALKGLSRFSYRREMAFFLWLCGIARRLIQNHYRVRQRHPPPVSCAALPREGSASSIDLSEAVCATARSPSQQLLLHQNIDLVALAMQSLPSTYRESIVLRYLEEHSNAEAASILGLQVGAFRVRLSRALVLLRDTMDVLVRK